MYFDRVSGQKLEVEAITGAIVAVAEHHGIDVPTNRTVGALLQAISGVAF